MLSSSCQEDRHSGKYASWSRRGPSEQVAKLQRRSIRAAISHLAKTVKIIMVKKMHDNRSLRASVQIEIGSECLRQYSRLIRRKFEKSFFNQMPYKIFSNSSHAVNLCKNSSSLGHMKSLQSKIKKIWKRKKAYKTTSNKRRIVCVSQPTNKVARRLLDSYKNTTYCRS